MEHEVRPPVEVKYIPTEPTAVEKADVGQIVSEQQGSWQSTFAGLPENLQQRITGDPDYYPTDAVLDARLQNQGYDLPSEVRGQMYGDFVTFLESCGINPDDPDLPFSALAEQFLGRRIESPVPAGLVAAEPAELAPAPVGPGVPTEEENERGGLLAEAKAKVLLEPQERMSKPRKGFVEEIDDILAGESGPEGKVFASPRRLAGYLQSLPLPQGASLQNLNIKILDGRSAQAQGEISKGGSTSFTIMLAADGDGTELRVQSSQLNKVAMLHRGSQEIINQALGNIISTLKDQLNGQLADKAWKTAGFSISEDGKDFVISFGREQTPVRQAREELQGSLDRRQQWAKRLKKERPSNREIVLASPLFKDKTQEEIEAMANELFESDADSIVKGKFGPDEELMQKLRQFYHPDEVRVLKDLIIQKLDQAGDEARAKAWRGYLWTAVPAPQGPVLQERAVGQTGVDDWREGAKERARENARDSIEQALRLSGVNFDQVRTRLGNPNLSLRQYAEWILQPKIGPKVEISEEAVDQLLEQAGLGSRTMANNIFTGRVLPGDELIRKVNEKLTNQEDKEALKIQIAAKVRELAEKRDALDPKDQAFLEAWEREVAGSAEQSPDWDREGPPDIIEQ